MDATRVLTTCHPLFAGQPGLTVNELTDGLHLAYSRSTADWILALTSALNDSEQAIRSFLEGCFRSDDHNTHHM